MKLHLKWLPEKPFIIFLSNQNDILLAEELCIQWGAYPRNNLSRLCYSLIAYNVLYISSYYTCFPWFLFMFWLFEYKVFNFSTGRVIDKAVFDSAVTAMDHDHTGRFIFCGDAQVCLCLFIFPLFIPKLSIFISQCLLWICRDLYTQSKLILTLVNCLDLIVIVVVANRNLQLQLYSTEPSLYCHEDLCCCRLLEMEVCLISGLSKMALPLPGDVNLLQL